MTVPYDILYFEHVDEEDGTVDSKEIYVDKGKIQQIVALNRQQGYILKNQTKGNYA